MGAVDPSVEEPAAAPAPAAVVAFRCEQCGAPVTAEPGADSLTCAHCGHRQAIERKDGRVVEYDFEAARQGAPRGAATDLATGAHEVECKGCGARTVITGQSQACSFCGSPLIADLKAGEQMMLPESLLPHKVTREQAKQGFQGWLKSRWFAPSDLVRRSKTAGLDGVMLPHWTYDSNTSTSYVGMRGDYYYVTVGYTDSKGNRQTRTERRTRWSSASGTVHVAFDDVLVCASRSLPEKLVRELEPWDLPALQPFDPAYLAGFVTERYQIDLEQGFELAEIRMRPKIRAAIDRDIGGDVQQILSMSVTHRDVKFKHLLLPLWISSFRYGERVFRVVVNARTGEVQGERPWSWVKILLATLVVVALIGAGIWLYQSSRRPGADDVGPDDYTPAPTDQAPPMIEPPPPPDPAQTVIDPLGQLAAIGALAREHFRDPELTGIAFDDVDEHGVARGGARFEYRSPSARKGMPCTGGVRVDGVGLHWYQPSVADDCAATLLAPPTCSLAEVMARVPVLLEDRATPAIRYQRRGASNAEAPPGRPAPKPSTKPMPGEWWIQDNARIDIELDDCHPPPAPTPPPRRRPVRPR